MKQLFLASVMIAAAVPAVAGDIVYPSSASPAAIAAHKIVLAEVAATPANSNDVACAVIPAHPYAYGRDPDANVRLALIRDCYAGIGNGYGGQ